MRHSSDVRWWLELLSSCHVYLINDVNCPTGANTLIPFDAEDFDNLDEYDLVNHRFYPQHTGFYKVCPQITFLSGGVVAPIDFMVSIGGVGAVFWHYDHFGANRTHTIFMSRIIEVQAGQYVEVYCSNSSGATVVVRGQSSLTNMWIERSPVL